jgi:hypothetical protein
MSSLRVQRIRTHAPISLGRATRPRAAGIAHQRAPNGDGEAIQKKGGAWPPSRRAVSAVHAALLITAVGSPSNVSRSDRSTTVAMSRRRSNLSHRAYTAVTPLRV